MGSIQAMTINVKLFAAARQCSGREEVAIELSAGATVGDLRAALATACPELNALLPASMVAVDHDYAANDQVLPDRAEVALIPPVSGG